MGSGGRGLLRPASDLGPAYEATLSADARRRGAHYTPAVVAAELVELALARWERGRVDRRPPSICDPSCGGGAFLVAALDALVRRGVDPTVALGRVHGIDSDAGAVEVSRASLRAWAAEQGPAASAASAATPATDGPGAQLVVGDGLLDDWPGAPYDVIVGNPPFQNQLRALTARDPAVRNRVRELFADAAVGYVDTAALFLLAALRHVATGGVVCLIQPRSTASATHAAAVRRRIAEVGVVELWWPEHRVFDAAVDVWAPVISATGGGAGADLGAVGAEAARLVAQLRRTDGWSDAVATRRGVPELVLAAGEDGPVVGDVATVSAGFRDEFYGLIPYVSEAAGGGGAELGTRLVTVGAIEPLRCTWGERPVRFAGRRWERPVVDAAAARDDVIGGWVRQQGRPKVLVATQTRWVEAVADPDGSLIGVTPTIAVTPDPGRPDPLGASTPIGVEHLAVALSSPVITLLAHRRHGGTALVSDAVRLSAAAVRALPLPGDRSAWDRAVELSNESPLPWAAFGAMMCAAYEVDDQPVLDWWLALARQVPGAPSRGRKGV